jgi:ubiquinone/menaquinone biosynthesis C-methylase UbiE
MGERYNIEFTGIDVSQPAIEYANILRKLREEYNCHFIVMDAHKLSFKDETFDVILCTGGVIGRLTDPLKCLYETYPGFKAWRCRNNNYHK